MEDLRTDASPIPELRTSEAGAEDDCSSSHHTTPPNGDGGTGSSPIKMPQTIHLTGSSRIHIGPLYNCIDPASVRTPPPGATSPIHSFAENKKGPPKPHVEALLKSEREVTDAEMDIVCTHIGYGWKQLGHLMKYSDGQLDNIDANSHRPLDKAHELISMWRDRESQNASVANLTRLLMMSSAYDVVKRLHP